jgi:hypothetical protein
MSDTDPVERRHYRGDRVTLLGATHHAPEGARQGEADHQQQEDFQPVGPRGRILKRVSGIGVIEPAAVGAELLDRLLAGHRTAGHRLLRAAEGGHHLVVEVEILDRATGDEQDRARDRDGQQDAKYRAHQVHPEVPQLAGAPTGEPAHQRDRDRHADRGRHEVLDRQPRHLHEVTVGGLTGVGLPVGVGDEADRGVPRQRRGHGGAWIVQMQRQLSLHQLQREQDKDADRGKRQNASRVGTRCLLGARIDPDQAIDQALGGQVALRCVHPVHVVTEGHMDDHQRHDQDEQEDQPCRCGAH